MMNAAQFLAELELLSYSERIQAVVAAGRDPQNAPLWDELERGDSYQRRLALQSCQGSRDSQRVARFLGDESRLCRSLAVRLAADICDAGQLLAVFVELLPKRQRQLLKRLAQKKRHEVVEALVLGLPASAELEVFLPYASREFIEAHFARYERASAEDWGRLARQQPALALGYLLSQAHEATRPDRGLLARANEVLVQASDLAPAPALELVRALVAHHPLHEVNTHTLLSYRPQELAELALESGDTPGVSFTHVARRLSSDTLIAILTRFPIPEPSYAWQSSDWLGVMKKVRPKERALLWERFGLSWRDKQGAVSPQLLQYLPRDARHAEARRHFELPALAARPHSFLPYAAFLSWEEARLRLKPFLGDPDPELRALAFSALGETVRYERAQAGEWLALVKSRGNEGDPVRGAMLGATAKLPPTTWKEAHLDDLKTIQRQAPNARDLSYGTARFLEVIDVALLPHFPEWAGEQISELIKERGNISFFSLADRINDAQMRVLGPRLLPILRAWKDREHTPFIGAMGSLGRRLRAWDEGTQLLVTFIRNASTHLAPTAAQILRRYRLDAFRALVPELVTKDISWGTQHIVYQFLHRERQDLLAPALLGRERPKGRFWTGRTRFVLPLTDGFYRWTPEQQQLFSLTLGEVIQDSERDTPAAIRATLQLAAIPDIRPTLLLSLSRLSNPRAALREAAIRALSHLDGGQGVPELIEALDDERGRIAIYGLRRALMEMPVSQALAILRATPLQKVTVAKEVLRLLGDLKTAEALDVLFEFDALELHRDVRVALLRALWEHLEDERVWPVLERAAVSDDPAIARMAARTTASRLSSAARERLNVLLAQLLSHPEPRVRMQVLESGTVGALSDPNSLLLPGLMRSLESPLEEEYKAASTAIWRTYVGRESEIISESIARLLPHRRALDTVIDAFLTQFFHGQRLFLPTGRAIEAALARDPIALPLRLRVALHVFEMPEFAAFIEQLAKTGQLHAGALLSLTQTLELGMWQFGFAFASNSQTAIKGGENDEPAVRLEKALSSSEFPEARRLALAALIGATQDGQGWTPERVARLEAMRRDPAPLVASAAQWTFVPGED